MIWTVLCDELSSLGTTFVSDMLDWARDELQVYLQPIPSDLADPLYPERSLNIPAGTNLLDYQNLEESLGRWVVDALSQADSAFGQEVSDSNAPDGSGRDLGVNKFMRDRFLDQNRAFTLLISDLAFQAFDPVLFKSHDKITETTITLIGIRMYGLDTFKQFDPLVGKSSYEMRLCRKKYMH